MRRRGYKRNADERLRSLQRRAHAGDPAAVAELLRHRVRVGDLPPQNLEAAAFLGDPDAMRATGHGPPRRDPGENARRRLWHEVPGLALDSARAAVGHAVGVFFNDPRRRGVPLAWPGDPGYVFELVDVWRISHEDVAREEADNIYLEWADAARELEEVAEPNAWYGWDRLAWALAFLAASVETPLEEGLLDPRWASYESYEEAALQEAEGALADLYSLRVPSPTGLPGPVNVRISRLRARRELAEAIRREVVPRLLA